MATGNRQNSKIKGHHRRGKLLVPPLLNIPAPVKLTNWLRDGFPDMLWLCSILKGRDSEQLLTCCRALDVIDDMTGPPDSSQHEPTASLLHGTLTSFESVPDSLRPPILTALKDRGIYSDAFPEDFAHALGMYPKAPGSWIIEPWKDAGLSIDWERAQRFLSAAIVACQSNRDATPTAAQFLWLRALVKHRRLRLPRDLAERMAIPDLFSRYPDRLSDKEMSSTESLIRSMYGGCVAASEHGVGTESDAVRWAKQFWRSNWKIFPCSTPSSSRQHAISTSEADQIAERFWEQWSDIHHRFVAVSKTADPDLYSPERFEVLTGLTAMALRTLARVVRTRALWSIEHGSFSLRQIVESLIVLTWLISRDQDDLYLKFKAYGRGHLKLQKLHLQELLESTADPALELQLYYDQLAELVNQDLWEEFQEISLQGSFAGLNTRDMAREVGMEHEYNWVFAPASAASHGEWAYLDMHALDRCQNPLHRWHRIPRGELTSPVGLYLLESACQLTDRMVATYGDAVQQGI